MLAGFEHDRNGVAPHGALEGKADAGVQHHDVLLRVTEGRNHACTAAYDLARQKRVVVDVEVVNAALDVPTAKPFRNQRIKRVLRIRADQFEADV